MRMDGRRWTWTRRAALVVAAGALTAGCGDDATGPGGGAAGPAGALAQVVGDAAQDVVVDNEPSFESAAFFAPHIATLLSTAPEPPGRTATALVQQVSCFAESVLGMTYDYDFSASGYLATNQSGAPVNGARFLLYALNSSGSPQQGSQLGQLDVTCTAEPTGPSSFSVVFSLSIVAGNVSVLTMNMSGPVNVGSGIRQVNGSGSLTSADGSRTIAFEGGDAAGGVAGGGAFGFSLDPAAGVTAAFARFNQQDGTFYVLVSATKQPVVTEIPEWAFEAYPEGTGQTYSGATPVRLTGADIGTGVFACIGGSFTTPQITASSDCSDGEYEIENVGSAERQAVGAAYDALRSMWTTLFDVLDLGIEVALAAMTG